MTDEHISFPDLEPGDQVDETHLKGCPECRRKWGLVRFLRAQIRSIPRLEPSPFFAARMAALIRDSGSPFVLHLQWAARCLSPVFLILILATTFLLYQITLDGSSFDPPMGVLFEEPQEEVSLDFVVNSLLETNGR